MGYRIIYLKYVPETTIVVLTNLINTSFSTGIFPDELKTAIIVPIHKKGNTSKINNYRPVALL